MKNHPLVAIYLSLAFLARESASFRISPSTSTRRVGARGTIHAAPASMGMGTCTVNGLSSASRTDANSAWTTTTTMMMTMAANRPKRSANHPRKSFEFQLTTTAKTTATTTLHNNYNYNNNNNNNNSLLLLLLPTLPPSLPKYLPLSLLHILGGTTGTSTVLRATKSWYKRISLPPWTPPNFVFGPVWTTLYGLMGYSVHRILHPATATAATIATRNIALRAWSLHYLLNLSWAPLFFGFQCLRAGLVVNILLLTSLSLVILPLFRSIDPVAAYVQLPYLAWLAYATVLNNEICRLNPMVGGVNEAMVQADLCDGDDEGYNEAMLEYDLKKLQKAAERYADGW